MMDRYGTEALRRPILVVGGYGYRNAGDEAMLTGLLNLLGRDGTTVVSRAPAETTAQHGVRAVSIGGAPAAMVRHRGLVIGGGGLFGRDMGALGRLLPVAGIVAAAAGRPVVLTGIGVDDGMPQASRWLLAKLGERARSVVVRDEESRRVLAELGVTASVAPDLSSLVASAGRSVGEGQLRSAGLEPSRRPVVGLCLTAVNASMLAPMRQAILEAVDARQDLDFCLIPMSRHPFVATHNDETLARSLVVERPRLRVLLPPDDPAMLLGVFEALGAAVCMRYHSLLFADRAGLPIVGIAYAEKCRHWLSDRGLEPVAPTGPALLARLEGVAARAAA
ncbi:MAG: polysaccharide pyruvyl transferase family protein [Chloroflexota bacterium]